jgi:hypothetical protein
MTTRRGARLRSTDRAWNTQAERAAVRPAVILEVREGGGGGRWRRMGT